MATPPPPPKSDMAPILHQLNLPALRTRMLDLQTTITRIIHTIHTNPSINWPDVLGQFSIVNVELLSLVEDIKPILRAFVVHPKNVTLANAQILPIMLSSKLLPEIEAEEAALKEHVLTPLSNLPLHVQTDKLQKQIELVRTVCDAADKVLADARKSYGLGARQGVVPLATVDKAQAARVLELEKQLYGAASFGEGLKNSSDPRSTSGLPPHIAMTSAYTDDGYARGAQSGVVRPANPQQIVQGPPAPAYANSPRPVVFAEMQTQQQQALLVQKAKLQKPFQQQLRQPATPPLTHMQVPVQNQVPQSLLPQASKLHQFPQNQLHMGQPQMQDRHYQMPMRTMAPYTNLAAQGRMQYGTQSQRLDPSMYMTGSQSAASLGLPLHQQGGYNLMNPNHQTPNAYIPNHPNMLGSQGGGGMLNPNAMQSFNQVQVRQQQPPQPQQQPPTQ